MSCFAAKVSARYTSRAATAATTTKFPLAGLMSADGRYGPHAELVAAYRSGASTNQLCRRYDISKGGVLKHLADHGVNMRYQPITEDAIN